WSAFFSPDDRSVVISGSQGLQRLPIEADAAAAAGVRFGASATLAATGQVERVSLDARASRAAYCRFGQAFVADCAAGAEARLISARGQALDCAISPDGKLVAVVHSRGASMVDAQSRETLREIAASGAESVAFSPTGTWLVIGASDGYQFWKVEGWQEGHRIARDRPAPGPLAFTADGTLAAMPVLRESRHVVRLLDVASGRTLATLERPAARPLWWLCFDHDGSKLALSSGTHTIEIWDLKLIRSQLAEMGLDWKL
ncbi:MAG: hypothetical protein HY290_24735, partial [Planctomycetia bacterium]|nr:hypothetical protein [Planctomycetia bacterium]